jgi:uncharacterized protein YndB with AHSA1/START domain
MTADPLVVEFEVAVGPAHAFEVWTRRPATWWPASHTVSKDPSAITFEPRAGGRIVERAPGGEEHQWGTVLDWQPPRRLRYAWQLFFDPGEATEIEITFTPVGGGTAVRLEQRGWDRLGPAGPPRRSKTADVWAVVTAAYADACAGPRA